MWRRECVIYTMRKKKRNCGKKFFIIFAITLAQDVGRDICAEIGHYVVIAYLQNLNLMDCWNKRLKPIDIYYFLGYNNYVTKINELTLLRRS